VGPELTDADRQLIDQRLDRFMAADNPGLYADAVVDPLLQSGATTQAAGQVGSH
jgi:hypothetical protein